MNTKTGPGKKKGRKKKTGRSGPTVGHQGVLESYAGGKEQIWWVEMKKKGDFPTKREASLAGKVLASQKRPGKTHVEKSPVCIAMTVPNRGNPQQRPNWTAI